MAELVTIADERSATGMSCRISTERLQRYYELAREALFREMDDSGHWVGELSASALATATAVMALEVSRRQLVTRELPDGHLASSLGALDFTSLIDGGCRWLIAHQNPDGGWGDTTKSLSNLSTTMLAHAALHATRSERDITTTTQRAEVYIERAGGVKALVARYGKDRTFSIPILTHCALAGLVEWADVTPLPFELACLPAQFYRMVRLPVVSYALPALIAIGQTRYFHRKPKNVLIRLVRRLTVQHSLDVLSTLQPQNGGFLEATPLTSFVTMSLASMGQLEHAVTLKGLDFIRRSVRPDGSWPIDTNLSTWVTTLAVNALGGIVSESARASIRIWLLDQQYKTRHPYTHSAPGGWAWTDLPGGVPDADDTPGAILALFHLRENASSVTETERESLRNAIRWLLDLQNADHGWPTFCRGWGTLPFDRSAPDLTAHVLRALSRWLDSPDAAMAPRRLQRRAVRAVRNGFRFLCKVQRLDGAWLPLWFGNQAVADDLNPTYGTARVLAAYRDTHQLETPAARAGLRWLANVQNPDGGWGGDSGIASSVEETALATEILCADSPDSEGVRRGLNWLMRRIEDGTFQESAPIGFYFAKLWYFERLYPLIFAVAALGQAAKSLDIQLRQ